MIPPVFEVLFSFQKRARAALGGYYRRERKKETRTKPRHNISVSNYPGVYVNVYRDLRQNCAQPRAQHRARAKVATRRRARALRYTGKNARVNEREREMLERIRSFIME